MIRPALSAQPWRHWYLLLFLVTLLAIGLKGWNQLGLPFPLDGDAPVFLPQTIHYRLDGRLINTDYWQTIAYAPERDGRYIWHGFLFPLLTAHLLPRADYRSLAQVVFGYEVVTLVLLALALSTLRPRDAATAFAMATPIFVCGAWLSIGRPEPMAFLWLALGLLAFLHTRPAWHPWIVGITLGLTGATSLVPAAFLGLFYVAYQSLWKTWLKCILTGLIAAVTATVVFAATFLIYPYTFIEWCHGTRLHASFCMINHHLTFSGFISGWVKNTTYPLPLFWLGLFAATLAFYAWRIDWRGRGWLPGLIIFSAIIFVVTVRTSGDERLYNIICLAPIFLFATQSMLWSMAENWTATGRKVASLLLAVLTLITILPELDYGVLRFYVHQGLDRDHAEALVEKITQDNPGPVDFSYGLFSLFTQPRGGAVGTDEYLRLHTLQSQAPVVLIQQINPYQAVPPVFSNYTLAQNYFTNYVPKFCGIPLAQSPRVYNFAVYRRNVSAP